MTKINFPVLLWQIICSGVIAFMMFGGALYFIFPGKLQPFAIPHSDIYMPLAIANTPFNALMPRPTGNIIDFFRGSLGVKFSIIFPVGLVLLNCVGTFLLTIRLLPKIFSPTRNQYLIWLSFAVYVWMICTHRYFYIFSGWDAYAQYSYFFLLCAVWWTIIIESRISRLAGLFLFSVIGFLAKETYAVSFIFLIPFVFREHSAKISDEGPGAGVIKNTLTGEVWLMVVVVIFAFLVAYRINSGLNSPFIGGAPIENNPYKISLSPLSILHEWSRYAKDGWNWPIVVCLGSIFYLYIKRNSDRHATASVVVPFIAGVLAWVPNSLLPNHYFEQYSFTGSYLYYLPIVIIICGYFDAHSSRNSWIPYLISTVLIALPFFNSTLFKKDVVQFYVVQMKKQENYLKILGKISAASSSDRSERPQLLVGITPPFNPFDYPSAFLANFFSDGLKLDVVGYSLSKRQTIEASKGELVIRRIDTNDVDLSRYAKVWIVALDGAEMDPLSEKELKDASQRSGLGLRDLILYPEITRIFLGKENLNEKDFVDCGQKFQEYAVMEKSLECYVQGMKKFPDSPYPYFFYALGVERTGDIKSAILYMERAVDAKNQGPGNPAFAKELVRLQGRRDALQ